MINLNALEACMKSIPRQCEVDSPYFRDQPPSPNEERRKCATNFGCISIFFEQQTGKLDEWNLTATKVLQTTKVIFDDSHFILEPIIARDDPFSIKAKETGCYLVHLKGWRLVPGKLLLPQDIEAQFKQVLTSTGLSVNYDG